MALNILSSNRVEVLQSRLAQRISEAPLGDPFAPETIVVPTYAMGRWLNLQFAKQQGIAANFEYPQIGPWIWQRVACLMQVTAQTDPYSEKALGWQIFKLLPGLLGEGGFELLNRYLDNDQSGIKRWQLSQRIARCFDRYQLYRPQMITSWAESRESHWQAKLWRAIVADNLSPHRVAALATSIERLKQPDPPNLPQRISLFALSSLAPAYVELLHALASQTEVTLYQHSPTDQYWADLVSEKTRARRRLQDPAQDDYFETRNSLLTSWGRQGQVMQDLLLDFGAITEDEAEDNRPPGKTRMLHCLQSGLFDLALPPNSPVDDSISIHICHSPMRECQVLHDQLLMLLQRHADLKAEEILVMVPEIGRYAPYIEAVFQYDDSGKRPDLPWNISDISIADGHPLIKNFLQLLRLPESRFTRSEIVALLESSEIRNRFGIDSAGLEQIHQLLDSSQLRWGVNAEHRQSLGLPDTHENTWQQTWERLFCGYAMSDTELWQGIAPIDDVGVDAAIAIAGLKQLFDRLLWWRARLSTSANAATWQQRLHQILDDFFTPQNSSDELLQPVRDLISDLGQTDSGELSPSLVRHWMEKHLSRKQMAGHLYSGGVTFCGLQPMRNIPFKVICLLGMQDQAFPRRERPPAFDLMQNSWQPGDPLSRDEDRYLMLETLLGARQYLYFSYCGRSLKDNSECQASTLLRELTDYIDNNFRADDNARSASETITRLHPMQVFSSRNFSLENPAYDQYWYHSAQLLAEYRAANSVDNWPQQALDSTNEKQSIIELAELVRFYRHPIRYFFRKRLGIHLPDEDSFDDDEVFALDGLQQWAIIETMAARFITANENDRSLFSARGLLPHGRAAESEWIKLENESRDLLDRLRPYQGQTGQSRFVECDLGDFSLSGEISACYPEHGLMHFSASKNIKGRAVLGLWLEHLSLCATHQLAGTETSRLLIRGSKGIHFKSLDATTAAAMLTRYIQIYLQGQCLPLPVFPNSSYGWASCDDPDQAQHEAQKAWQRSFSFSGENQDRYIQLALHNGHAQPLQDPLFQQYANQIYGPAIDNLVKDS